MAATHGAAHALARYRARPTLVIADELVNGLHHQWIEACMQQLGERQ